MMTPDLAVLSVENLKCLHVVGGDEVHVSVAQVELGEVRKCPGGV